MPPQLVVANAPSKKYPGGLVAVRASDWLGAARGTLTTESDALASTGIVVRDAQQVTPDVNAFFDTDDYSDADDTLTIPVDDIGLRDGFDYIVWITYKVDGDWDDTNGALLRRCNQRVFNHVCAIGMHGDQGFPLESSADLITRLLGHAEPYSITRTFVSVETGDVLHFRAFAHNGVSAEVLIDQLVFVPFDGPSFIGQEFLSNNADVFTAGFVDGADGGDTNGKFTWKDEDIWNAFVAGVNSSDYQRFAEAEDGEYLIRLTPASNFPLADGVNPITAFGYSLHAVRHEPFFTEDTFDNRTTSGRDMGINEDGYGYRLGSSESASNPSGFVSGGVGILRINNDLNTIGVEFGDNDQGTSGFHNQGAQLNADDAWIWSGLFEWSAGQMSNNANNIWQWYFRAGGILWTIRLLHNAKTWQLFKLVGSVQTAYGSVHDISAWFAPGAQIGLKVEVKRYKLRLRLWDASGAEPSTWDEDFFRDVVVGGTHFTYPYSDVIARAQAAYSADFPAVPTLGFGLSSSSGTGEVYPFDVTLHHITFERDMYGDPEPMTVRVEQPEGTLVGEQEIPYGCPYFVYWGGRVWTEAGGGTQRLSYSTKLVNDPSAGELQRADSLTWDFLHLPSPIDLSKVRFRAFQHGDILNG